MEQEFLLKSSLVKKTEKKKKKPLRTLQTKEDVSLLCSHTGFVTLLSSNWYICKTVWSGCRCADSEERLMNWLLGKNRYNPLIRPASNKTARVPVKLQVSLAQLISVVRSLNASIHHEIATARAGICAEVTGGKKKREWEGERRGGAQFETEVNSKEKARAETWLQLWELLSCDHRQVRIEASAQWIKRGHKAAFASPDLWWRLRPPPDFSCTERIWVCINNSELVSRSPSSFFLLNSDK